jgi:peptide deformylase
MLMILPIVAYGAQILRKVSASIDASYPALPKLLEDMWETMYSSSGVGLAAPQINKDIRLFVIDATSFAEDEPSLIDFKKVFINAEILEETGEKWSFNEGCLSIPDIREDVERKENVKLSYFDENWVKHEETFSGLAARVIQHEYDHIEGKLFVDKLSPLRKTMLNNRLSSISKGMVKVDYKMKFPAVKKGRR